VKAVVQRVSRASVSVAGKEISRIERGYLVLAGVGRGDSEETLAWVAHKIASLRIFEDESGRMSLGLDAVGGDLLVVSQFTLHADVRRGTRPSFDASAPPDEAQRLFGRFVELLEAELPGRVVTGEFGAMMEVSLVNDGPVTIIVERE